MIHAKFEIYRKSFEKNIELLHAKCSILYACKASFSRREIQRLDLHQGGKKGRFPPAAVLRPTGWRPQAICQKRYIVDCSHQ